MYLVHCTGLSGMRDGLPRRFSVPPDAAADEERALRSIPYTYPTKDAAFAGAVRLVASGREVLRIAGPDEFDLAGDVLHALLQVESGAPGG